MRYTLIEYKDDGDIVGRGEYDSLDEAIRCVKLERSKEWEIWRNGAIVAEIARY